MSPLTEPTRIILRKGWQPMDPDAAAYISAVETADGQALEEPVKIAIDNFVLGCKADGIWDAIKASCILAGARTLAGALVPLVGTAPTNVGPFTESDYNRKNGLKGNASSKYLNSNQGVSSQDNCHLSAFISEDNSSNGSYSAVVAAGEPGWYLLIRTIGTNKSLEVGVDPLISLLPSKNSPKFCGLSQSSLLFSKKQTGSNLETQANSPSNGNPSVPLYVFADNYSGLRFLSDFRLSFYSIGEALDLALLDARVTDLINKFAEVLP